MTTPYLGEDLILVLSPPRAGSTMLQRILGSHSAVQTHPEPHILTPLAFQGYFYRIERAAFNHTVAARALREFVEFLPRGEEDYLDACREYCRTLYGRARSVNGKSFFLDKTPNYSDSILPFVEKLLPRARLVVLTRHPIAQLASTANTFYGGNFGKALALRDAFSTFIPAMAQFIRNTQVPFVHVRYEDLVTDPEPQIRRLLDFIGLPFEPACVHFGDQEHITKTFGDPKISQHKTPVGNSADSWVQDLVGRTDRVRLCRRALAAVSPDDLAIFGYPANTLWQAAEQSGPAGAGVASERSMTMRLDEWLWQIRHRLVQVGRIAPIHAGLLRLQRMVDQLTGTGAS